MGKTLAVLTLVAALALPAPPAAALEVDDDLMALVAMPLAVAAVSEIADVPANDLIDMVTLLNDANVPPVQFVETVRYVPVALVVEDTSQPRFVEVVRQQQLAGVNGLALVTFIEQRLYTYGLPQTVDLDVTAPRVIDIEPDVIVPPVVRTRIVEVKSHPHGGPPGQLKKAASVQTGAEIVHRNRGRNRDRVATPRTVVIQPEMKVTRSNENRVAVGEDRGKGHGKGHGNSGGGHGGGHGKGKGKGKG